MIVSNEYHLFESLLEMLPHDVLRRKNIVYAPQYIYFLHSSYTMKQINLGVSEVFFLCSLNDLLPFSFFDFDHPE